MRNKLVSWTAAAALSLCATHSAFAQMSDSQLSALVRRAVVLAPPASLAGADISTLRRISGPQIGEAMTCLRLAGERGGYIAVFIEGHDVVNYRRAVVLDGCERVSYAPLSGAGQAAAKPARPRQISRKNAAPPAKSEPEATSASAE